MKRCFLILVLIISKIVLLAQEELPRKITVESVWAGDGNGHFYKEKDSLIYTYNADKNWYESLKLYHINGKRSIFKESEELHEKPLVEREVLCLIESDVVTQIISLYDTSNMFFIDVNDTICFPKDKSDPKFFVRRYLNKPLDIKSYGLNMDHHPCLCEYFKSIERRENSYVEKLNCADSSLIHKFLRRRLCNADWERTSHSEFMISLTFHFKENKISIYQKNSMGFNCAWRYYFNDVFFKKNLFSPELNQAVNNLLPQVIKQREKLIEYKDIDLIYKDMFKIY